MRRCSQRAPKPQEYDYEQHHEHHSDPALALKAVFHDQENICRNGADNMIFPVKQDTFSQHPFP